MQIFRFDGDKTVGRVGEDAGSDDIPCHNHGDGVKDGAEIDAGTDPLRHAEGAEKKPHAESAKFAEPESHAESAETAEP